MEVARGRRKPSGRDRLSNLPDCLLHAILSQLRSRQAVQTCALSRRWAHLWRGVSCIHIDSADFSNQQRRHHQVYSQVQEEEEEEALAKLEDFADSLVLSRGQSSSSPEPPLDSLRLRVHRGGPRGDVNMCRWIRRGLKLSPAALDVSGGDGYRVSLTSLPHRVSGGGARRLTRLRLDNVVLQHDFRDRSLPCARRPRDH
ncbi:MEIOTIC F-BOX protein MOF-like [Lolium perenne]|uniref:MEIOTIC F-BOX protein MOF-like n=1 Tax=Lolium perenne TaxID=4522 RepID=UPI0021F5DDE7|nr:MEIOTIC F-BOX protein MOF-like [Lolium perenne]